MSKQFNNSVSASTKMYSTTASLATNISLLAHLMKIANVAHALRYYIIFQMQIRILFSSIDFFLHFFEVYTLKHIRNLDMISLYLRYYG